MRLSDLAVIRILSWVKAAYKYSYLRYNPLLSRLNHGAYTQKHSLYVNPKP